MLRAKTPRSARDSAHVSAHAGVIGSVVPSYTLSSYAFQKVALLDQILEALLCGRGEQDRAKAPGFALRLDGLPLLEQRLNLRPRAWQKVALVLGHGAVHVVERHKQDDQVARARLREDLP